MQTSRAPRLLSHSGLLTLQILKEIILRSLLANSQKRQSDVFDRLRLRFFTQQLKFQTATSGF
ncbi:hypothetical protein [Nostoc sp. DSM 114160]